VQIKWLKMSCLLVALISIYGCAEIKQTVESFWDKITAEQSYKKIESREEAVQQHGYKAKKDYFKIFQPSIQPETVMPGEKLRQEMQFTLLAPTQGKKFKIYETVNLSSNNINIELSKKERELEQGSYISIVQIVIPKDIPLGEYKLITTVNIENTKKTVKAAFKVRKS
jgi:hypothetical protein